MEENVALDSTKKKKFLKSIKGIKKLIKKNEKEEVQDKPAVEAKEKKKDKAFVKQDRGLVYLSHIPHGFYEHQMTEYFKQFGAVTNVRVIRSKRTGKSKGFAFIEFREPSVAQIVAETMNNYLMGKRLLKAGYIPPEKQRRYAKRKNWNEKFNPGVMEKIKHKKAFNAVKNENEELKKAKKMLSNLQRTKTKLSELGINYDFFMPVDVPLALIKVKKEKDEKAIVKEESDKDEKSIKKGNKIEKQNNKGKEIGESKKEVKKTVSAKADKEIKPKKEKNVKKDNILKIDKKEQEKKQEKLDKSGVKNVENFIKVQESDNDSDSSVEFDSDEYEKMISDESEVASDESDESEEASNESDESGDEFEDDDGSDGNDNNDEIDDSESGAESIVDYPPEKPKGKVPQVLAPKKNDKAQKPQEKVNKNTQVKRKAPQKAPVSTKKPKFEKQNKPIPVKKQFKKKK